MTSGALGDADRDLPGSGENVDILPGGFLEVTHAFPESAGDDPPGQRTDCSASR